MKDTATLNAKGHVKLELYNDSGVFYKKEKHNLVVNSANEIVANMMADPAKVVRVHQTDKGDSALSANAEALYPFALTIQHEAKETFENNWGQANTQDEFVIEELKGVTKIEEVLVGSDALVVDQDVFLLDAEAGKIKFAQPPTDVVKIRFRKVVNPYMKVIAGTEKVTVDGEEFKRAAVAKNEEKTYQVDYKTGEILFSAPVENVKVEYDYHMNYCLGFMALGGKPEGKKDLQPVEFGNSNKLDTYMENELPGSRMPIIYPASVSRGATELDPAIPTQPVATALAPVAVIQVAEDEATPGKAMLVYPLSNSYTTSSGTTTVPVYRIRSVQNVTQNKDITGNATLPENSWSGVKIAFAEEDVAVGDEIKVEYELKINNSHLHYALSQAPVVKLVSVSHISTFDQKRREYLIVDDGLKPNQGDVWISDANRGVITFTSGDPVGTSQNPDEIPPRPETPGQLQVEYMVNAGVVVRFVADFPKGVPAPVLQDGRKEFVVAAGQTSLQLDREIAKDENEQFIKPTITVRDGVSTVVLTDADYTILSDGKTIVPNSMNAGDEVTVEYKYEKTTHDIYQVAMFDKKEGGTMFNISGIGPVTKDKNTGMRVTWSVTY